jgi:hypothetical protein
MVPRRSKHPLLTGTPTVRPSSKLGIRDYTRRQNQYGNDNLRKNMKQIIQDMGQ